MKIKTSIQLALSVTAVLLAAVASEAQASKNYAVDINEWIQVRDNSGDSIVYYTCADGTKASKMITVKVLQTQTHEQILKLLDKGCK